MSSETGTSILDAALACIGKRISMILPQSGDRDENYITSLHNEVLAAVWIVGLQSSAGSSPVPESIRVAFGSFSDIGNPGSYTAPNGSLLPQGKDQPSDAAQFNFTEWWVIGEGETMGEPFDVRDEVVDGLLHALKMQETSAHLRAETIDFIRDAINMVTHIGNMVKEMDEVLNEGIEGSHREFNIGEEERLA